MLSVPPSIDKMQFPTYFSPLEPAPTASSDVPYHFRKRNRTRRQASLASSKIEPELLLFCDNAMVKQFEGDTDELLEYLLHFWHAVRVWFITVVNYVFPYLDVTDAAKFWHGQKNINDLKNSLITVFFCVFSGVWPRINNQGFWGDLSNFKNGGNPLGVHQGKTTDLP